MHINRVFFSSKLKFLLYVWKEPYKKYVWLLDLENKLKNNSYAIRFLSPLKEKKKQISDRV